MTDRPMIYLDDAALAVLQNFTETAQLEAIAALAPVQVGVKPLEWRHVAPHGLYEAYGLCWKYQIRVGTDGIIRWQAGHMGTWFDADSVEAAKAAAQADYESRIRSALIKTPVDAAHIRAEALRDCIAEAVDLIDSDGNDWDLPARLVRKMRETLIAAPSPDVGGGSTGFGASYQRETDCWVIYSLPRMAPFARMDGFANENVKWAVEALRAAHIRSAPSPDVGALAEAAAWAFRHVSFMPMDEATASEFVHHRAALAKMKGGAE